MSRMRQRYRVRMMGKKKSNQDTVVYILHSVIIRFIFKWLSHYTEAGRYPRHPPSPIIHDSDIVILQKLSLPVAMHLSFCITLGTV